MATLWTTIRGCTFLLLILLSACAKAPDPELIQILTSGVWHAVVGEDDYVYEFSTSRGVVRGKLHRAHGGRHINEIPLTEVSINWTSIQIGHGRFPPYRGQILRDEGRIEGGVPGAPRFREMNLVRADKAEWPGIWLRGTRGTTRDSYNWVRPEEGTDGWRIGEPSEVGIDPEAVEATVRSILAERAAAMHSFLVVRDNRLVVEEYFHGWSRDDLHEILSCTKSVVSLLIGIARDQGRLADVDVPVKDFFPEYRETSAAGWEAVRLEHLLTMSSGLRWARDEIGSPAPEGIDRFADVFRRDVAYPPGSRFQYVGRAADLLSGVLLDAAGVEADKYAAEHLFGPLGIEEWDWSYRQWRGHPDTSAGLELRPRDMAKVGQLILDEGSWQGEQLVSAEWIRESTATHVAETPHGVQYGYLWWRVDPVPQRIPTGPITFANGIGGQFIAVIPSARMVLVATAGNPLNGRQFDIVRIVETHLLPGVSRSQ